LNRFEFFATIERYHTIQNPTSEEKLDLAASYCAFRDGTRVLDVGCGKGWLARRLAKRFDVKIVGLEINRVFATEARDLAAAEGLTERIEIVQGPALDFHPEPASFDVVMCIGASFALGGFEPALDWMKRCAKPGGIVAIGEVFAMQLPLPANIASMPRYSECGGRSLWTTVEAMRSRGLILRGMVESSRDDWNRYHSLHWQAALDWALANPGQTDIKILTDPTGQRCDLEFDGRYIGWAIFVARNGLD
jgi:SAM-dependent methyltransferase